MKKGIPEMRYVYMSHIPYINIICIVSAYVFLYSVFLIQNTGVTPLIALMNETVDLSTVKSMLKLAEEFNMLHDVINAVGV